MKMEKNIFNMYHKKSATREKAHYLFKTLDKKKRERKASEKDLCAVWEELYPSVLMKL